MARGVRARLGAVFAVAAVIAGVTIVIFLVRAGDPGVTNWPEQFELRSSDNGVLFQFSSDVFAGRPLDWSFSPQVFVFPEIPISLIAYLLAGESVQGYYLAVAAINNALLFLGLFAVIRYLFAREPFGVRVGRACVAMFPLLLLPLLGTTWLLSYTLAPTYYFGMYLMIIVAPTLFLARRRWVRVAVGIGIALTGASNPLAFVFVLPPFTVALIARGFASGIRFVVRPIAWAVGVVLLALVIRVLLFTRLQGASPLAYVDSSIFAGRVAAIRGYLSGLFGDPTTATVILLGAAGAIVGMIVSIVIFVRLATRRSTPSARAFTALYFGLVPIGGLLGTIALIITDYLYLWPVLVAPLVLLFLPLPRAWVPRALPATAASLVLVALATGAVPNLVNAPAYFTYRSSETRCLDSALPSGITTGYATFSDARRLELTSARPFHLIQLKSSGVRAYWLTNRDYARDSVGKFFYINDNGDEPPISTSYIESHFGTPDSRFTCGPGETVLIYTQPSKLAKIRARYSTLPAP